VAFFPIQEAAGGALAPLMPMLPVQFLWINLVATVALALPLAFEAKEPHLMRRAPRAPSEPVLSRFVFIRTAIAALVMAAGAIGLFAWELQAEPEQAQSEGALRQAQTMAVTAVILFQVFYLLMCRSLHGSLFKLGLFSNPMVFLGIGALVLLQLGFIYLPFMQKIFGTAPLGWTDLGLSALAAAVILPVISAEKAWRHLQRGGSVPAHASSS
jgi:magnesium-transporting ATPase (P-type)